MTFAEEIETEAEGPIEAVVIGWGGWSSEDDDEPFGLEAFEPYDWPRNVVLKWDEARLWLDREYDSGYGSPSCPAVTIWTASKVGWVTQYDGSTRLSWVHRNPVDHVPEMPGG